MIYATPFNRVTKETLGPSVPLNVDTLAKAKKMFNESPVTETAKTVIYAQVGDAGLCISPIRFAL